jgi:hypothetical protein
MSLGGIFIMHGVVLLIAAVFAFYGNIIFYVFGK